MWRSYFLPPGDVIYSEAPAITAVMAQGKSVPHDSTIKREGDAFAVRPAGQGAMAAPTITDNGAAEFDIALSGSGPWTIALTWLGAGLSALTRGVYARTITVTSVGAANSPLNIPVTIIVL